MGYGDLVWTSLCVATTGRLLKSTPQSLQLWQNYWNASMMKTRQLWCWLSTKAIVKHMLPQNKSKNSKIYYFNIFLKQVGLCQTKAILILYRYHIEFKPTEGTWQKYTAWHLPHPITSELLHRTKLAPLNHQIQSQLMFWYFYFLSPRKLFTQWNHNVTMGG